MPVLSSVIWAGLRPDCGQTVRQTVGQTVGQTACGFPRGAAHGFARGAHEDLRVGRPVDLHEDLHEDLSKGLHKRRRVDLRVARRAGFSAILRVGRVICVARPACEGLPSRQNCLTSRTILPIGLFLRLAFHCGEVAQLGEHRLRKAGVEGSNPFFSTTISRGYG